MFNICKFYNRENNNNYIKSKDILKAEYKNLLYLVKQYTPFYKKLVFYLCTNNGTYLGIAKSKNKDYKNIYESVEKIINDKKAVEALNSFTNTFLFKDLNSKFLNYELENLLIEYSIYKYFKNKLFNFNGNKKGYNLDDLFYSYIVIFLSYFYPFCWVSGNKNDNIETFLIMLCLVYCPTSYNCDIKDYYTYEARRNVSFILYKLQFLQNFNKITAFINNMTNIIKKYSKIIEDKEIDLEFIKEEDEMLGINRDFKTLPYITKEELKRIIFNYSKIKDLKV